MAHTTPPVWLSYITALLPPSPHPELIRNQQETVRGIKNAPVHKTPNNSSPCNKQGIYICAYTITHIKGVPLTGLRVFLNLLKLDTTSVSEVLLFLTVQFAMNIARGSRY
jgi:hypothetical protein